MTEGSLAPPQLFPANCSIFFSVRSVHNADKPSNSIGTTLAAVSLFALIFTGCASKPPTVGEPKEFLAACDKDNEGKRVAVEGYLRFHRAIDSDVYTDLDLYRTAEFNTLPISVPVDFGAKPNQIDLPPKEYTHKDLKVHLANGQVAGFGTKVKVSGEVSFSGLLPGGECALKNPLVELAQ